MTTLDSGAPARPVRVAESAASHWLHRLFEPRAVAVVGASSNPAKVGNRICRQLVAEGYEGELVPVSLRPGEIAGFQARSSLRDIEGGVDVAVIATATEQVADALRDCVAAGVGFAIVHTAGFAETGPEGKALEDLLVGLAHEGGVRLMGPNCMQMYNATVGLNLIGTPFPSGRIGMISQSGNLVRAATEEFELAGLGFSSFVTVGNQADLKVHDYLDYLKDDPNTDVILVYVEGLAPGTGPAFLRTAREAAERKPVVLLKGGVTDAGSRSSVSHTGSLAGEARVFAAAMHQAGVLMIDRLDEMVPVVEALSRLPLPKGPKVAVVGGGGGHATLCADAVERAGLMVPVLSSETQGRLAEHLPPRAGIRNPIDFTGASEREIAVYAKVPEIILEEDTDAALLYGLYAGYRTDLECPGNTYVDTSAMIVEMVRRLGKPAIMQTVYAQRDHPSLAVLRQGGVPVMASVEHAAAGLAALWRYARARQRLARGDRRPKAEEGLLPDHFRRIARSRPQRNLTEAESFRVLEGLGLKVVPHREAASRSEARDAAERLGYPVVVKALAPDLIHKSDAGGVALDLRNATAVEEAYERVTGAAAVKGTLIASHLSDGRELITGAYRDQTFGPVIAFGLGGTAVEALDDVCLRVLPIDREEAADMLDSIRGKGLLGPQRGKPGVDRDALVEIIMGVNRLMVCNPDVVEVDLNPVLAFAQGAFIADARILFGPPAQDSKSG